MLAHTRTCISTYAILFAIWCTLALTLSTYLFQPHVTTLGLHTFDTVKKHICTVHAYIFSRVSRDSGVCLKQFLIFSIHTRTSRWFIFCFVFSFSPFSSFAVWLMARSRSSITLICRRFRLAVNGYSAPYIALSKDYFLLLTHPLFTDAPIPSP